MKGAYLLDEYPLIVMPTLAKIFGLNQAIILQQSHYWLQKSKHSKNGKIWFYKTYSEWSEELPFWSDRTIRRTISELEKEQLIITSNFNKKRSDKTKWYTINYKKFSKVINDYLVSSPSGQIDNNSMTDCPVRMVKVDASIPDTTTDNTTATETGESDGVSFPGPLSDDRQEVGVEISHTPEEDDVDKLASLFIQLRGKGLMIKAEDYQAISRVLSEVPFKTSNDLLEQCFKDYKPQRPGSTINTFSYCEMYILDKYQALLAREQAKKIPKAKEGEGDEQKVYQSRRGNGRSGKQGKSMEDAIRELKESNEAWE